MKFYPKNRRIYIELAELPDESGHKTVNGIIMPEGYDPPKVEVNKVYRILEQPRGIADAFVRDGQLILVEEQMVESFTYRHKGEEGTILTILENYVIGVLG